MRIEITGIFGFIIVIADVWAIVNVCQSDVTTGKKVAWIVGILIFPVIGFLVWWLAGPREKSGDARTP
ncbi:MAG: PLD nuclease N-terminal domain-containing protein [Candidatus Binatia bacterium]